MKRGSLASGLWIAVLLACSGVGCGSPPKPATVDPTPPPRPTTPSMPLVFGGAAARQEAPKVRCAKIHAENERAFGELGVTAGGAAGRLDFCQEDKRGAWGVSLAKARKEKDDTVFHAELVRFDASGAEARIPLPFPKPYADPKDAALVQGDDARTAPMTQYGVRTTLPFDFDNDGTPELAISTETYADEWGKSARAFVFAAKAGAIEPYAPAKDLVLLGNIGDADGDGRPDFATAGPFVGLGHHPQSESTFPVVGPVFGVRTRPDGTLGLGDESLPSKSNCGPNQKDINDAKHQRAGDYALAVACNRVWNTPDKVVAEAIAKIEKGCPKKPEANEPEVCANLALLRAWSRATSPVHEGSKGAPEPPKKK